MKRLIQFLLLGHEHKWKIIQVKDVYTTHGSLYQRYYLQCEHCGDMRTFNGSE